MLQGRLLCLYVGNSHVSLQYTSEQLSLPECCQRTGSYVSGRGPMIPFPYLYRHYLKGCKRLRRDLKNLSTLHRFHTRWLFGI